MPKTFIHFGFQKTGTTTLQKHVFPHMRPLIYSARSENHGASHKTTGITQVLHKTRYLEKDRQRLPNHGFGYDDEIRKTFELEIDKQSPTDLPLLISDENLLGPHPDGMDAISRRIRHAVGPAGVILVLRDSLSFYKSMYRQNLLNMLNILNNPSESHQRELKQIHLFHASTYFDQHFNGRGLVDQYFQYNKIVESLDHWFGAENLLLLSFDHLKENFGSFISALSRFMGAEMPENFDINGITAENVAGGRLEPLLCQLMESGKISDEQSRSLQEWYDACQLTDEQIQLLRDVEARDCEIALSRCVNY